MNKLHFEPLHAQTLELKHFEPLHAENPGN